MPASRSVSEAAQTAAPTGTNAPTYAPAIPVIRQADGRTLAASEATAVAADALPTPHATSATCRFRRRPSQAEGQASPPIGRGSCSSASRSRSSISVAATISSGDSPRGDVGGGALTPRVPSGGPRRPRRSGGLARGHVQQGAHVGGRVVRLKVLGGLAHADELDRQLQLAHDGKQDAALAGAVELRDDHAGKVDGLVEPLGLLEPVLAGDGVEHQPDLLRLAGIGLADHAADLLQLLHQVVLRVEAPGGVDEQQVGALRLAGRGRVVRDRSGVASVRSRLGGHAQPVAPHAELRGAGGAERVAGSEHHASAKALVVLTELRDRRGLADAVHADDHHDVAGGLDDVAADVELEPDATELLTHAVGLELVQQRLLEGVAERGSALALALGVGDDVRRDPGADVRADERELEVVPVHLPALAQIANVGGEHVPRLAQPLAKTVEPPHQVPAPLRPASTLAPSFFVPASFSSGAGRSSGRAAVISESARPIRLSTRSRPRITTRSVTEGACVVPVSAARIGISTCGFLISRERT